jgi:hypothetical protein
MIIFLFTCIHLFAGGSIINPIYTKARDITTIAKVKILSKEEIKHVDTCINRKILYLFSKFVYHCQLISNIAGDSINDFTFVAEFEQPDFKDYNDSCQEIEHYWINEVYTGIEEELMVGNK